MTQLQKRRLHLPHHSENLLYILALALSPIGNYLLHMLMLGQYQTTLGEKQVWLHGAIDISYALFIGGAIPALLILLLRTRIHRSADVRWLLGGFGIICILDLLLNVVIINLAILDNESQSYLLLLQAFVLYLSTNLIFFFWYWFIDYPEQLRHLSDPTDLPDILFPEQSGDLVARWKPHPIDYLFFTILCSNTLGPPEGHLVFGRRTKLLQIGHTITTLVVFLVLVARAINTLPARAITP
jgi:hypothetical protein